MNQKLIIGIGGAGCYLANEIQVKVSCSSLAIDRTLHLLNDYNFANKIEISEQDFNGEVLHDSYKKELLGALEKHLKRSSVLVLAVGLGGYLGTTLGVEIVRLANSVGINVVCIAYLPFAFETERHQVSFNAIEELRPYVNELIVHDHAMKLSEADQSQSVRHYLIAAGAAMVNEVNSRLAA